MESEELVSSHSFPLPRGNPACLPARHWHSYSPLGRMTAVYGRPPQPPVLAQVLPRRNLQQPSPGSPGLHLWLTRDSVSASVSCPGASGSGAAKLRTRGEHWRVRQPILGTGCRDCLVAVAGCSAPPHLGTQPDFRGTDRKIATRLQAGVGSSSTKVGFLLHLSLGSSGLCAMLCCG